MPDGVSVICDDYLCVKLCTENAAVLCAIAKDWRVMLQISSFLLAFVLVLLPLVSKPEYHGAEKSN